MFFLIFFYSNIISRLYTFQINVSEFSRPFPPHRLQSETCRRMEAEETIKSLREKLCFETRLREQVKHNNILKITKINEEMYTK